MKAKIYTGGKRGYRSLDKPWYVYAWFTDADGKRRKYVSKGGINRFHTVRERLEAASIEKAAMDLNIKDGWNPFVSRSVSMMLSDALEIGREKREKHLAPKSYRDFTTVFKRLLQVVPDKPLVDVTKNDMVTALDKMQDKFKLSDKAFNKALFHTKALFSEFTRLDLIKINPVFGIEQKRVKKDPPRRATMEEKKKLQEFLSKEVPGFWNFCLVLYYCGIRPNEIINLQVKDFEGYLFRVKSETAKTDGKVVPIPAVFIRQLQDHIGDAPPDHYIFSRNFIPGPILMSRRSFTKWWERWVYDKLKFKFTLYSLKGLGGDDKRRAQIPLEAVQYQFGHKSKEMTLVYLNEEDEYVKALQNAPAFIPEQMN